MFLKLAHANEGAVSIFECTQVHIVNTSKDRVRFELLDNSPNSYQALDVIKGVGDEVYLMNDEGKTIDTYRWPYDGQIEGN